MESLLMICSKPAKVTSKQGFRRDINKSTFSDKVFQSYSFGWKKDLWKFFINLLIWQMKDYIDFKPKKNPMPQKIPVTRLFLVFVKYV